MGERLASYPGVLDIRNSFRNGKRELVLELLPSAEALGLSVEDLGRRCARPSTARRCSGCSGDAMT